MSQDTHAGYLRKCKPRTTKWQKRWCVLKKSEKIFAYYGKEGDSKPKGTIDLSEVKAIKATTGGSGGGEGEFVIAMQESAGGREYFLAAADAPERAQWLAQLNSIRQPPAPAPTPMPTMTRSTTLPVQPASQPTSGAAAVDGQSGNAFMTASPNPTLNRALTDANLVAPTGNEPVVGARRARASMQVGGPPKFSPGQVNAATATTPASATTTASPATPTSDPSKTTMPAPSNAVSPTLSAPREEQEEDPFMSQTYYKKATLDDSLFDGKVDYDKFLKTADEPAAPEPNPEPPKPTNPEPEPTPTPTPTPASATTPTPAPAPSSLSSSSSSNPTTPVSTSVTTPSASPNAPTSTPSVSSPTPDPSNSGTSSPSTPIIITDTTVGDAQSAKTEAPVASPRSGGWAVAIPSKTASAATDGNGENAQSGSRARGGARASMMLPQFTTTTDGTHIPAIAIDPTASTSGGSPSSPRLDIGRARGGARASLMIPILPVGTQPTATTTSTTSTSPRQATLSSSPNSSSPILIGSASPRNRAGAPGSDPGKGRTGTTSAPNQAQESKYKRVTSPSEFQTIWNDTLRIITSDSLTPLHLDLSGILLTYHPSNPNQPEDPASVDDLAGSSGWTVDDLPPDKTRILETRNDLSLVPRYSDEPSDPTNANGSEHDTGKTFLLERTAVRCIVVRWIDNKRPREGDTGQWVLLLADGDDVNISLGMSEFLDALWPFASLSSPTLRKDIDGEFEPPELDHLDGKVTPAIKELVQDLYSGVAALIQHFTLSSSSLMLNPNGASDDLLIEGQVVTTAAIEDFVSIGDERVSDNIGTLVRSHLCSTLARVLSDGFDSFTLFGRHFIWDYIHAAATASGIANRKTAVAGNGGITLDTYALSLASTAARIQNNPRMANNPSLKFRAFVCAGLNEGSLAEWMSLLGSYQPAIRRFYYSSALWRHKEAVQEVITALRPCDQLPMILLPTTEVMGAIGANKAKTISRVPGSMRPTLRGQDQARSPSSSSGSVEGST